MRLIAGSILVGATILARVINGASVANAELPALVWIFFAVGIALMVWELIIYFKGSQKKE